VYTAIDRELRNVIAEGSFDLAILAFWYIAETLINDFRRTSPETRLIVDSMDLHFMRHARRTFSPALRDRPDDALGEQFAWDTARELNTYGAADAVMAVSQKEADLIGDLIGDPALGYAVPDCEDLPPSPFPFDRRRGMLFIGNFEHPPNVDAVTWLCEEIVPLLDPGLLAQHPLTIVGNDSDKLLRMPGVDHPHVQVVGWVPSVMPYLERTRVSLIPLLYGAGTKRKLIQSLMIQTPSVSTTIGIEGLDVHDGEELLVADDPAIFASSIERLLVDAALWKRLVENGRGTIVESRGREITKTRLLDAVEHARSRTPKDLIIPVADHVVADPELPSPEYRGLVRRIRRVVREACPPAAKVLVISRGDPELLDLGGREGWHFPQDVKTGQYAGYHPGDSDEAIDHLTTLREQGAEFLLIPSPDAWWLEHYGEFAHHLDNEFKRVVDDHETCMVFDLRVPMPRRRKEDLAGDGAPGANGLADPQPSLVGSHQGPLISVAIPTHNRADLLRESLESLAEQTLGMDSFEVIVVDDGSTDHTEAVCSELSTRLPLRRHTLERSGIAAAKNAGALAATGEIVLFFDDDDVADPNMLAEHVRAHRLHPDPEVAVLGYTGWSPTIEVNEVMHFVTDVGHYLFSYDGLTEGQELDFTYFWGGRTSCKRSFLLRGGLFRPEFTFGSEDIELAYRLSRHGLKVVYWPRAAQYMIRPITYDDFCNRCERQGISQWMFGEMHDDPMIQEWCGVVGVEDRWKDVERALEAKRARVHEVEEALAAIGPGEAHEKLRRELWDLYWWTFDASKVKGIVERMRASEPALATTRP
jgi:glycosyltransferase involved in cell wall biosynthesis